MEAPSVRMFSASLQKFHSTSDLFDPSIIHHSSFIHHSFFIPHSFIIHSSFLIPHSSFIHHSFIIHSSFIHYSFIIHSLFIHHSFIIHSSFIIPHSFIHSFIHPSSLIQPWFSKLGVRTDMEGCKRGDRPLSEDGSFHCPYTAITVSRRCLRPSM